MKFNAEQKSTFSTGISREATPSEQLTVLQATGLTKVYHEAAVETPVLERIDLQVQQAEMIAICGASGSGKSTLLHLLGGLDRPSEGQVQIMQQDIWQLNETQRCILRNQHLGFVYQFHHLLPDFNVAENVMLPLLIAGQTWQQARPKAVALLQRVGLAERLSHRTGELSGGERQRVAIARALVNEPSCVLADEPTGNLDLATAQQVFEIMLQLNQELKTSFILVTHNLELAANMHKRYDIVDGNLCEA